MYFVESTDSTTITAIGVFLTSNLKTANKCAELIASGLVVISPIFYGHNLLNYREMPGDWKFWQNFCETFLVKSDELWVYKIEGWDLSTGLLSEIELAKQLNIPIRYIEL